MAEFLELWTCGLWSLTQFMLIIEHLVLVIYLLKQLHRFLQSGETRIVLYLAIISL